MAFAERLGVELEIITAPDRASLRRLLKEREIDLAAAQLTWHRGWKGVGLATRDYSESPLLWVYARGTPRPKNEAELQGQQIVILADSTADAPWLEPILLQIEEVAFLAGVETSLAELPQPRAPRGPGCRAILDARRFPARWRTRTLRARSKRRLRRASGRRGRRARRIRRCRHRPDRCGLR